MSCTTADQSRFGAVSKSNVSSFNLMTPSLDASASSTRRSCGVLEAARQKGRTKRANNSFNIAMDVVYEEYYVAGK